MSNTYQHKEVEKKWQNYWYSNQTFFVNLEENSKPKKFILAMFPYPSGSGLHVGHIKNYTIVDSLARFYRLNGYNVLMPIGWDSFGLPAEQYAIKTNNHPSNFTNENIARFRRQLLKMGFSYDWSKEINTSEKEYYKWTQWIFRKIYFLGLADYKKIPVFWCDELSTVLSNEEIKKNSDGEQISERGNFPVIKKEIFQWSLRITKFARELLSGLADLDWPTSIKSLQRNWIGLNEGTFIHFPVFGKKKKFIEVFTKSPQTVYGVIAVVISLESTLLEDDFLLNHNKRSEFNLFTSELSSNVKKGEMNAFFTGSYCLNPLNNEKIPIWVGDFVLPDYGSGAVMINAFSEEIFSENKKVWGNLISENEIKQNEKIDLKFAQKYGIERKEIYEIVSESEGKFIRFINSPIIDKLRKKNDSIRIMNEYLEKKNIGRKGEFYHLKDWVFSRQRYWGEPIPVIHWEDGSMDLVDEKELPLVLPHLESFVPSRLHYAPLQRAEEWLTVNNGKKSGKRDWNVMPQWAGSCWYYIAFLLKNGARGYLDLNGNVAKKIAEKWLPVDIYVGGQEHANLHLLYARFWHKILYKIGVVSCSEPFKKLICQGMILGKGGEKMSKSLGNVINPDDIVSLNGADALRVYEVFLGPVEKTTNFDIDGVRSMKKWLDRVYNLFIQNRKKFTNAENFKDIANDIFFSEKIVLIDSYYRSEKLNLVVSSLMSYLNHCHIIDSIPLKYGLIFLQMLNPIAPHITEEIWSLMEQEKTLAESKWPKLEEIKVNPDLANKLKRKIVIQVNGKKKALIEVKNEETKSVVFKEAMKNNNLREIVSGKHFKIIFIKNKVMNIVLDSEVKN